MRRRRRKGARPAGIIEAIMQEFAVRGRDRPVGIMAPAIMRAVWQMSFTGEAPVSPQQGLVAPIDAITEGLLVPEPGR